MNLIVIIIYCYSRFLFENIDLEISDFHLDLSSWFIIITFMSRFGIMLMND